MEHIKSGSGKQYAVRGPQARSRGDTLGALVPCNRTELRSNQPVSSGENATDPSSGLARGTAPVTIMMQDPLANVRVALQDELF